MHVNTTSRADTLPALWGSWYSRCYYSILSLSDDLFPLSEQLQLQDRKGGHAIQTSLVLSDISPGEAYTGF